MKNTGYTFGADMGEAKRRGTFEQRKAESIMKRAEAKGDVCVKKQVMENRKVSEIMLMAAILTQQTHGE